MAPRKPKVIQDITLELNYTQTIKDQISFDKKYDCNWDEERVRRAAHFCKIFHNHKLDPYEIQRLIKEFEDTVGFDIEY